MKIIHLFWAGARELSSSWLLATCGSLFSSWFRLLFRFFRCHFLRSSFWLCLLFWRWSILGFNISIINLILRIVLIVVVVKMTTPSTVCHGHVTFTTFDSQAIFLIEHLASDIWASRYTLLHLWNPIEKPWKALLASVLRTKHTAPEKKPSDRSNAARPGEVEKKHFCTLGLQSENQEKRFWQASSGRSSRLRRRNHQAAAKQRGREE